MKKIFKVTAETEDILWGLVTGIDWVEGGDEYGIEIQDINFETKSVTLIDNESAENSTAYWHISKRKT